MKFALIGPPYSGKSTLFSAITGQAIDPAQAAMERLAVVKVPDERLDYLSSIYKPKKYTEATLDFVDFPGVSLAEASGQAEFRKMSQKVRNCDGLVVVVRGYQNDGVPAYRNRVDPKADLDELHSEMIFADLEQTANRITRIEDNIQRNKDREANKKELALFQRIQTALESEAPVSTAIQNEEEAKLLNSYQFLTRMPLVLVINVGEDAINAPPSVVSPHAHATVVLSAEIESEITQLDPADRAAFQADMGITESARAKLIRGCYEAAGLISFLTAGEDEVRAWTIRRDISAVDAAGKIHSDIARGFIRAETVAFDDFKAGEGMKGAKAAGKVRLEGKQYVVQDGDIINFRFNV